MLVPAASRAQALFSAGISAGPSMPISDLSESHKIGYNAAAYVGLNIPVVPVSLQLEGFWSRFGPRAVGIVGGGRMRIAGGNLNLVYDFGGTGIRPYLIAGVGVYNSSYISGSRVNLGYNAGTGTKFQLAGFGTFVEARLHMLRDDRRFRFLPVTFGVEF